jgi:iron(II)-dependent oxidoreductase
MIVEDASVVQDRSSDSVEVVAALEEARARTLELVAHLSAQDLESVHSPLMSPLVWDMAHIAAYEDLWLVHRHAGHELLHGELAAVYDAFETPRAVRGSVERLDLDQTREYMTHVRQRTVDAIEQRGVGDGRIHEMVLQHELQHTETMRQTMGIAALLAAGEPPRAELDREPEWLEVQGGCFQMGSPQEGFAFDNERPRHQISLPGFEVASQPVRNGEWREFCERGGYARSEWWSREGWHWLQAERVQPHPGLLEGPERGVAMHVSWFEAQAFARAAGARLPSEAEWERCASALGSRGCVWEWTSTNFGGYPGFHAHPYREYSEVFFGDGYRVLRGGSWATSPRVARITFRNWDLPQRRQIFAGLRLAKDLR